VALIKIKCFECGAEMEFIDSISRRDECPKCRADVRVCKNCEFYDPKVYNECRETSAEVIKEKHRANLCDFFRPRVGGPSDAKNSREALLAQAEALFKKKD
jgi:hypothetical protein